MDDIAERLKRIREKGEKLKEALESFLEEIRVAQENRRTKEESPPE